MLSCWQDPEESPHHPALKAFPDCLFFPWTVHHGKTFLHKQMSASEEILNTWTTRECSRHPRTRLSLQSCGVGQGHHLLSLLFAPLSRVCFPATVSAGDPNRYQALAVTIITSLPSCLTLLPPLCRGLKRKLNYNRCSLLLPKGRADVEMAHLGRWRLREGTEKQESSLYFR